MFPWNGAIAVVALILYLWLAEIVSYKLNKKKTTPEQRLARRLVCLGAAVGVICSAIVGRCVIDTYAEGVALQAYCSLWVVAPFWMLIKYLAHRYFPSGKADRGWRFSIFKRCGLIAIFCAFCYFWRILAAPVDFAKYAFWAALQLSLLSGGRLITLDWYEDKSVQQTPRSIKDDQEKVIREIHMSHREDVRSTSIQVLQILTLFFTAASIASGWFANSLVQSHVNSASNLSGYTAIAASLNEQWKTKKLTDIASVDRAGKIAYTQDMAKELKLLDAADRKTGDIINSRLLNSGSFAAMLATMSIMLSSLIATIGALGLMLSVRRTGIGELSSYTLEHFHMLPTPKQRLTMMKHTLTPGAVICFITVLLCLSLPLTFLSGYLCLRHLINTADSSVSNIALVVEALLGFAAWMMFYGSNGQIWQLFRWEYGRRKAWDQGLTVDPR